MLNNNTRRALAEEAQRIWMGESSTKDEADTPRDWGAVVDYLWNYLQEEPLTERSRAIADVGRLAGWIMEHVPGEPSRSEGAVDTAIRLLGYTQSQERLLQQQVAATARLQDDLAQARQEALDAAAARQAERADLAPVETVYADDQAEHPKVPRIGTVQATRWTVFWADEGRARGYDDGPGVLITAERRGSSWNLTTEVYPRTGGGFQSMGSHRLPEGTTSMAAREYAVAAAEQVRAYLVAQYDLDDTAWRDLKALLTDGASEGVDDDLL